MSAKRKDQASPASRVIEYILDRERNFRKLIQSQVGARDVDDVFQEVCTHLLQLGQEELGIADPEAFAHFFTVNVAGDFSSRQSRLLDFIKSQQLERDAQLPASTESVEEQLGDSQELNLVLERLHPLTQAVLLLRVRDGYSVDEIAQRLGISTGDVGAVLARVARETRAGFRNLDDRDKLIYEAQAELAIPDRKIITDIVPRVEVASARLAERLKMQPQDIDGLTSRQFEHLIAELLTDMGCGRVRVTPATRDGGRDLLAYFDLDLGTLLCLVEAKKYRRDRPVGVELVRSLYGVVCHEDASHGMLVTTSTFSPDAQAFQLSHPHRLSLRDYSHLIEWIRRYGQRRH